jgi:hypothetical protein
MSAGPPSTSSFSRLVLQTRGVVVGIVRLVLPPVRVYWNRRTPPQRLALALLCIVIGGWSAVKLFSKGRIIAHNLMVAEEFEIHGDAQPFRLFVADSDALRLQGPFQVTPQQEVSILRPFAVVAVFDQLIPGKEYVPDMTLTDSAGGKVLREQFDAFKTDVPQGFVYQFVEPDRTKHKPGEWLLEVNLKDVGKVSQRINVLPPNATEAASLMRSEQAREHVYMAFSNYWLGVTERGETTFLTGTEPSPEQKAAEAAAVKAQQEAKERKAKEAPIVDQAEYEQFMARIGHSLKKDEPASKQPERDAQSPRFIQMAKIQSRLVEAPVSDADKLNGITYRGSAAFTFGVFRFYREGKGWAGWVDVKRPETDFDLMVARAIQTASETFNTGPAVTSTPLTSGLRFEFYEQDGNWFVISDQGDLFLNGAAKGKREFDQLQPSSPVLVRSPVFQPDQAILKDLLAPGTSARDVARAMGDKARASPEALKQQAVGTMSLLRGQNLAQ